MHQPEDFLEAEAMRENYPEQEATLEHNKGQDGDGLVPKDQRDDGVEPEHDREPSPDDGSQAVEALHESQECGHDPKSLLGALRYT